MTKALKKISGYQATQEHYTADACVVWCFDARFRAPFEQAFLRVEEINQHDLVSIAGGAKTLAMPDKECDREYLLSQIEVSLRLHHAKAVVLMMHEDCGACGGSEEFKKKGKVEQDELEAMLKSAKEAVINFLKGGPHAGVPVRMVLVKFDGIYELE